MAYTSDTIYSSEKGFKLYGKVGNKLLIKTGIFEKEENLLFYETNEKKTLLTNASQVAFISDKGAVLINKPLIFWWDEKEQIELPFKVKEVLHVNIQLLHADKTDTTIRLVYNFHEEGAIRKYSYYYLEDKLIVQEIPTSEKLVIKKVSSFNDVLYLYSFDHGMYKIHYADSLFLEKVYEEINLPKTGEVGLAGNKLVLENGDNYLEIKHMETAKSILTERIISSYHTPAYNPLFTTNGKGGSTILSISTEQTIVEVDTNGKLLHQYILPKNANLQQIVAASDTHILLADSYGKLFVFYKEEIL